MTFIPLTRWHADGTFQTTFLIIVPSTSLILLLPSSFQPTHPPTFIFLHPSPLCFHFLQQLLSPPYCLPLPLFQRLSTVWWSAHIERVWFASSLLFISPFWSVSFINAGPGSTKGRERHTLTKKENGGGGGGEEELDENRKVAHGFPTAVNTQVGVGEKEEVWFITWGLLSSTAKVREPYGGPGWMMENANSRKYS